MSVPQHKQSDSAAAAQPAAWQAQAELLNEMSRMAKVGGWEYDPVTGQGDWTDEVARIHDLDPATPADLQLSLNCYTGESRTRMEQALREALEQGKPYDLELAFRSTKGILKWVRTIGRPVVENGRVVKVWGTLQDISERKQAEQQIRHLSEVLRAIRNIGELIHYETDPLRLLQAACAGLVQTRGYVTVWAGRAEPETKRVIMIAHAGASFQLHAPITWDDSPTGRGPTGTALRERRPVVVDDLAAEPAFAPWRDPVLATGAASIASIPLLHGERLFGVLTVKADRVRAFDAEELRLLGSLANDLALALQNIENTQRRQQAEENAAKASGVV